MSSHLLRLEKECFVFEILWRYRKSPLFTKYIETVLLNQEIGTRICKYPEHSILKGDPSQQLHFQAAEDRQKPQNAFFCARSFLSTWKLTKHWPKFAKLSVLTALNNSLSTQSQKP